jgi:RNA polymerase sigma-70 factor (ECF subfamily)
MFVCQGEKNVQEAQPHTGNSSRPNVCNGDSVEEAMSQAFTCCRASFVRCAYRFLNNAADAEDAVQDALLLAHQHIGQFRGQAQISTWLTAIVSNSARMQLRKRPRQIHVSLDEPIGEEQGHTLSEQLANCWPSPEEECQSSEFRARLRELATQLSPPLRKAFQLRDLDGLTTNEAAHILGVPDGTVKAQLARARVKVKRLMRRARGLQAQARRM